MISKGMKDFFLYLMVSFLAFFGLTTFITVGFIDERWSSVFFERRITNLPLIVYLVLFSFITAFAIFSYFRLKEVTLSYDTDRKIGFINAARIYLTGINLLTFTDYLGMDPEFSYSYDPLYYGMDLGKAPLPKTVQLGVTLSF